MRLLPRPAWLLLSLLLAVLVLGSAGQRRRQRSDVTRSPGHWLEDGSAVSAHALRDTLQEVRQQLRAPYISRAQRRHLKARKRRLREELRVQRAQRRRDRRKRRRQQARGRLRPAVTAPEPHFDPAEHRSDAGLSEPAARPPPATALDPFIDSDETPTETSAVDAVEDRPPTEGDERPLDLSEGDETSLDLSEGDEQLSLDGSEGAEEDSPLIDGSEDDELDSFVTDGSEELDAPVTDVSEELDTPVVDVSEEEVAAGADSGSFLSSLWDWVAQPDDAQGSVEEPEPEPQDAGWTVPPLPAGKRPNIVIIMTDDLDVELGSLNYMPKLRRLLQDEGVTFRHGYVSTPLCCPSRSSYLTGMFVHNHQVYTNRDNCSSALWQQSHERRSYAAYLQSAGYRTGHFGKYMNRYDGEHIPAGWHHWSSLIFNSKYYNYSMNVNGRRREHGWRYPEDYLPSVIVNESLSFFESSRREHADSPVLMVVSFPGPHGPEDAAPQYTELFMNATDHHTPAYDFAPSEDKQWFLRHVDKMDEVERTFTDLLMTKRLQTLQSVDDGIEEVYQRLSAAGELDSTYIIFTSDHGYHLGQFGLPKGKSYPFEFDIRVPFVVRGPGVRAGSRSRDAVLNVDLAPTLLELAGLGRPPQMDGRSFVPLLRATDRDEGVAPPPWPDTFIVEGAGRRPEQRVSRRLQQGAVRTDDKHVLYVSALQRLQEVCLLPEYRSPCRPHQRWACYHDGRRWRLQKCRRRHRAPIMCPCRGGVVQRTRRIRARERQDQLRFLQEHVGGSVPPLRFVKGLRQRRSAGAASDSQLVKQFVVEQDVSHVDDDIRRIGYELHILQSHVGSVGRCAVDNTTCITPDRYSRRLLVNDQIRRLKQLLKQLKGIRRHLMAPYGSDGSETFEPGDFVDYADGEEDGDLLGAEDSRPAPRHPAAGRHNAHKTVAEDDASSDVAFCPCRPLDDRAERQWVREYTKQTRRVEKAQKRRERRKQKRRKQRKKERLASQNCNFEGLNCFVHDNDHWKTPPLWTHGPVCICLGSSNGTFDCLRSVGGGSDDNWLYCRFVTGFLSFYDLTVDPYQLHNLAPAMDADRLRRLDARLARMQTCRGPDQCRPLPGAAPATAPPPPALQPTALPVVQEAPRERRPGLDRTGLSRHVRRRRQRARARRMEWLQYRRRVSRQG
ncbi:extracellular sulfatase Sulf-1-like [Amphibalanus amphitrite]|uniref:extracellular sulfatase Sulf-1-like n=1 Tax=Amphibalanus amphitrite TaxID=1232801 RepID=UPI001C9188A7|nr:extracellular sulfatase Sulf-1-like [Amphibalanus amphitrite]